MATSNQARYWSPHYSVAGQWNRPHIQNNYTYEEDTFVTIRRSRKGTRLNIPTTDPFVLRRKPLSYIESIPVLPNGECCDMKYTLHRQLEETWLPRGQVYDPNNPRCTPSVTINIGTAPFGPSGMYSQQNMSMSTLSINPTVISEEPWVTQRTVTPLGLHCCGNRTVCDHAQSKTLQEAKKDPSANPLEDNKFVYLTTAPRISPLKSCWNFLAFKKKRTQGDVYLPAAITKAEQPKKLIDCPNCSNSIINSNDENGQMNSVPSTVAGSEMTISEFSSEEFISPVRRGEKEKKFKQVQKMNTDPQRITANNSQLMAQPSFNVNRTAMLSPPQYSPEGPVYWWVCKPIESKKNKKFLQNHPKKYICYRDQQ
ncbi:hypothetical protein J6590_038432 [Homalodisca vitripennis]|nr:hypothetical protein J6590_038432 [Homalodisca vitripennis]